MVQLSKIVYTLIVNSAEASCAKHEDKCAFLMLPCILCLKPQHLIITVSDTILFLQCIQITVNYSVQVSVYSVAEFLFLVKYVCYYETLHGTFIFAQVSFKLQQVS